MTREESYWTTEHSLILTKYARLCSCAACSSSKSLCTVTTRRMPLRASLAHAAKTLLPAFVHSSVMYEGYQDINAAFASLFFILARVCPKSSFLCLSPLTKFVQLYQAEPSWPATSRLNIRSIADSWSFFLFLAICILKNHFHCSTAEFSDKRTASFHQCSIRLLLAPKVIPGIQAALSAQSREWRHVAKSSARFAVSV